MNHWILLTAIAAHVLADGDVERAVQIHVQRDQIEVRYMVGMNNATLAERLGKAESDGGLEDWKAFAQRLQAQLPESLELKLDDRPLKLKAERWRPLPLHQLQIECVFTVELPEDAAGPRRLEIQDQTFVKTPGFARLAVKPAGQTNFQSTAQPIVARVERIAISEMSPEEEAATRIAEATWQSR